MCDDELVDVTNRQHCKVEWQESAEPAHPDRIKTRVMDYINRLNHYDMSDIANISPSARRCTRRRSSSSRRPSHTQSSVDYYTSLIFCYAKSKRFASLKEFISRPHPGGVAERCYGEAMHEAAKFFFNSSRCACGAPRPASGGRWRGMQSRLDAHVEGNQGEPHRAQGVPADAALRAPLHITSSTPTSTASLTIRGPEEGGGGIA